MHRIEKICRAAFGAAVLCALGMGATQAFAGPSVARLPECVPDECTLYCLGEGVSGGECVRDRCKCFPA